MKNQSSNKDGNFTDLKSLSGGERSYTTVSFLLALGYSVGSPFRCMDEFDVFMDAVSRRQAMAQLFEVAYQHSGLSDPNHKDSGLQFILLTPQDVSAVRPAEEDAKRIIAKNTRKEVNWPDKFVTVVKFADPRNARAEEGP